jgi:cytidylate kinase
MLPATELQSPPAHGYRGNPQALPKMLPQGLCVAISREAGARGGSIARKVGELLGWQIYDQETIDYLIQDEVARQQLVADLPAPARNWANTQYALLEREGDLAADSDTEILIRLLLTIAARGDAVFVGRGAGYLLPGETTLHVRVTAPMQSRVAYYAQKLRLGRDEAEVEVQARDQMRINFLTRFLGRDPATSTDFDIVVNSSRLGTEAAAQFIGWAVRTKQMFVEIQELEESISLKGIPEK